MESIRQAIERAKAGDTARVDNELADVRIQTDLSEVRIQADLPNEAIPAYEAETRFNQIELNNKVLQASRIISHDPRDRRSRWFDILRAQVLRSMDLKGWQFLGVISPTAGCGKTVTAINLAISIARQPERAALLVDMDLRKPEVAGRLGMRCDRGLVDILEGRTKLRDTMVQARIGSQKFMVLPAERPIANSSEWLASPAMITMLNALRREFRSHTVVFDLPPMLVSDDVMTILPQLDCVLMVAAAGVSTVAQINECNRHLHSHDVVRFVL